MIPVSDKVVQNARDCLENLNDDFVLEMSSYNKWFKDKCYYFNTMITEDNVCGTKFCMAGWQAHKEGYPEKYLREDSVSKLFSFTKYSSDKVDNEPEWDFFYKQSWSNDKEYAKERMKFVIENKAIPKYDYIECEFEGFPWDKEDRK